LVINTDSKNIGKNYRSIKKTSYILQRFEIAAEHEMLHMVYKVLTILDKIHFY